jgi:hypothetical protein
MLCTEEVRVAATLWAYIREGYNSDLGRVARYPEVKHGFLQYCQASASVLMLSSTRF